MKYSSSVQTLRVCRIPYLNTDPFFADWDDEKLPWTSATPRQLGEWARAGRLDAGLLSRVDGWELEAEFEPVGPYGIATEGQVKSVLLFSKKPLEELDGATIGVTEQTATSVRLLKLLLTARYGLKAQYRSLSDSNDAQLLIGDDALVACLRGRRGFPVVVDLALEWQNWQNRPFVFARWMVRRSAPTYLKLELAEQLQKSLDAFASRPQGTANEAAKRWKLKTVEVLDYLSNFNFTLGPREAEAEERFREYLTGKATKCLC